MIREWCLDRMNLHQREESRSQRRDASDRDGGIGELLARASSHGSDISLMKGENTRNGRRCLYSEERCLKTSFSAVGGQVSLMISRVDCKVERQQRKSW